MPFGLTPEAVSEFASKPFIQTALANPVNPSSVLSFFLGVDYNAPTAPTILRSGSFFNDMFPFWFGGHADYDLLCQPFKPVIRQVAAKDENNNLKEWDLSVDGKMAKLILCDQLSRNVFRGTDEAYQYDDFSLSIARFFANSIILGKGQDESLEGEFYSSYTYFVATTLMHSENIQDHENGLAAIEWANDIAIKDENERLQKVWNNCKKYTLEHKAVIERFGRYPHRNKKKGRVNTSEEEEWLSNVDELPAWAKTKN